jgi:hypothetical protein
MVYFQTKNADMCKFRRALILEKIDILNGHLEYLMAIWDIL